MANKTKEDLTEKKKELEKRLEQVTRELPQGQAIGKKAPKKG